MAYSDNSSKYWDLLVFILAIVLLGSTIYSFFKPAVLENDFEFFMNIIWVILLVIIIINSWGSYKRKSQTELK